MKKYLILAFAMTISVSASAQSMYDGIKIGDNNYYGTARSAAMGQAMTAVGGDLGSVGINPAGSAVTSHSTFTFTPAINVVSTSSSYASVAGNDFSSVTDVNKAYLTMPNLAVVMNFDTGRRSGIKSFTLGVIANSTNSFNDRMEASGVNSCSSMMGESAYFCSGIPSSSLGNSDSFYNSSYNWADIVAYQSGSISTYGGVDDQYIGSTEIIYDDGSIGLGGPIRQSYARRRTGTKTDILLNAAFNLNDKFYFGFNMGIPSFSCATKLGKQESAVDRQNFAMEIDGVQTCFVSGVQNYSHNLSGEGIYAKAGFIWLPVSGLRVGASIQTPTLYNVRETWYWSSKCQFEGLNSDTWYTPDGNDSYCIVSPMVTDFGVAWTVGSLGLVSMDWERADFGAMRYRSDEYDYDYDVFSEMNADIKRYAGMTSQFRLGAEYRLTSELALRAGMIRKKYVENQNDPERTVTLSCGLGYASKGAFFADLAIRRVSYPDSWYYPYEDYLTDASPEVGIAKKAVDVICTFGWRF